MPSIKSLLLREELKWVRPIVKKMSIKSMRSAQDRVGRAWLKTAGKGMDFDSVLFPGFTAAVAVPSEELDRGRIVLYLHGGSYNAGTLDYSRAFGGLLARRCKQRVFCTAYRLAPEHPFPAALEDAEESYLYLLEEGYAPESISLVGESAGGGLCLALALRLRDRALPMPGRLAVISPWADLSRTAEDYARLEREDPCLSGDTLAVSAALYGGERLTDPLVSPVFGSYEGLPPALIFVGEEELLLEDAQKAAERFEAAGVECALRVVPGMWHVYIVFGVPEAEESLAELSEFLNG